MKMNMASRGKIGTMQPSLKFFTSRLFQLLLHTILYISTRLAPLLVSIGGLSLFLITFNSPAPSFYPTFHRSHQDSPYASFSTESIDKADPWSFLSDLLLKLTDSLTNGTTTTTTTTNNPTDSYRFKPSRFSEPTPAQETISSACAEQWISSGSICPSLSNPNPPQAIELVWTWVNETATPNSELAGSRGHNSQSAHLYRQNDELKYSLRSSLQSLPHRYVNSRIILTADKLAPRIPHSAGHQEHWISRPNWLKPHRPEDSITRQPYHRVLLKHHSEIFKLKAPPLSLNKSESFNNYVPSHNSLAIESQFGHLTGIKNDFVYLNDDCFFVNKFGEGDFTSGLFGPVFRLQFDLLVKANNTGWTDPERSKGEWPSLEYSNYLLNMRFGSRPRRYIVHVAKVSNIQMMREVSEIWEDEISSTASSQFRGQRREVNMMFLTTWYQIEKHREAMLHSFLMLKTDANQDGKISNYEWREMMRDLDGRNTHEDDAPTMIRVFKPFRPRARPIEKLLGNYAPLQTDYEWISSDGYPLIKSESGSAPNYQTKEDNGARTVICELNVTQCFPNDYRRSEDLMRWISVEKPECGDCLISLLVGKSATGLEAFLPPASFRARIAAFLDQPVYRNAFSSPHKDTNQLRFYSDRRHSSDRLFSGNLLTDDPRIWAIRNLQRYQYVLGNTPSEFETLTTIVASREILNGITTKYQKKKKKARVEERKKAREEKNERRRTHDGSLVTINDRIHASHLSIVQSFFKRWLQTSWPIPAPWEITSS